MNRAKPARLGQILVERGAISTDQLRIALQEQARKPAPLGRLLVMLGFLDEATLREVLSHAFGTRSVDLDQYVADVTALACVAPALASRHRILPLAYDPATRHLLLAMADVHDLLALDAVRAAHPQGLSIETVLAGESEIARAIERAYSAPPPIDAIVGELETGRSADATSQPVVRLVEALLADAVRRGASDLHFEPEAGFLRIRYRLDGLLRQTRALHASHWPAIAVRLKVMAGMNIAETRAPQDGRISLDFNGRTVDFRTATQPTLHGENIVLRVLDRHKGIVPLDRLGLDRDQLSLIRRMVARPEGLILVTGPTGSGKTTTLYSILAELNTEGVNIMTLEDPVEYPMQGIRQSQVSEASRLGFAEGVRALLRQDPDVILVGEIRDAETAHMALEAAMTGHQVYSTLHTAERRGGM
ncbi:MAG: Flp pilus assembly complex ATPase component TadA, partial [Zoogloea sp.]|nr:Flp pilus assembly complex ATPase component TadA [Zoogloea sp.]